MSDVDLVYKATLDGSGFSSGASGIISQLGMMNSAAGVATVGLVALAASVVAVGAAFVASVGAAASWQTSLTEISKTTGVQGKELEDLSNKLQEIRMQTGATAQSMSEAVVTAGSIGIPKEELAEFAVLSQQMAGAFRMPADAAANAMGIIGNSVKPAEMSWVEFGNRTGSVTNVLADDMTTSEEAILGSMAKLSGSMGLLKPPEDTVPAWQALVATVQSLGLQGDTGGEAIKDAIRFMTVDAKGGISELLGLTPEQLQINLRTNAPEVFKDAAKAIAALPIEQQGEALKRFGDSGGQGIAMLMGDIDPLTGQFVMLDEAITSANAAYADGTGLQAAYAESQKTAEVAMDRVIQVATVIGERLGTIFLPGVSSALNSLADLGTGVANALADISDKIEAGDIKGAIDLLATGLESGLSNIGSIIVDYFRDIDYKAIGQNLLYALEAAWKVATDLFKSFMASDVSLSDAFSALSDVLSPTFESLFGGLKMAAISAYLAIGDGLVNTLNTIGSKLAEWINIAIGYFAKLAGAVDAALGGAVSDLMGTSSAAGASSAVSSPDRITSYDQINVEAEYLVTNTKRGTAVTRTGEELVGNNSDFFKANQVTIIADGGVSLAGASVSTLSQADIDQGFKLRTLAFQDPNEATYEQVARDTQRRTGGESIDQITNAVFTGDVNVANGEFSGTAAEQEQLNKDYENVASETDRVKDHTVREFVDAATDPIIEPLTGIKDAIKEGSELSDNASALEKKIVEDWKVEYKDATLFSQTEYGKQLLEEQKQYEELKAARDELHKQGLDDTKGAKDIEVAIEKAGDKIAENVAAAVTGIPAALYDPMFKASFQGQTKDYGPTAQENMQRQAEAALVNAQYGIVAVGSMNEYTQYAKEGLAAAGIEQISVKSLIDDAIAGLKEEKSTVDDTIASTNDLKAASKEVDFAEAKAGAEDLKSTCVEVEFSMENIAATASQIKFSRSASASPNALEQGIFETSASDPRSSQPQMSGGVNSAAGGLSNAALSAMQRYLSQIANNTNRINNGITSYGRSIFSAIQVAGTNAAVAVNANGSNIVASVNSQGGAIVGAINTGVAAIIKALMDKGSGNLGGPHAGMGGLGSVGSVWDGLNAGAGTWYAPGYIYGFSEGGYASHPTLAIVGDSPGGEFMVPRDRVGEFVNSYMAHQQTKIDGSGMRSQLMDAVGSLNVPPIHIPVVVDIDSEAIFEAVEYAFKSISSDIRLRARV